MKWENSRRGPNAISGKPLFESFFMAGFECSTHRVRSGRRLDLIDDTKHDVFARADYDRMQGVKMRVAREGLRWHLVETQRGHYDFSSVLPIVQAARETGAQVIWDLCHFGWPDHLDIFSPDFPEALASLAVKFTKWLTMQWDGPLWFVPVNEISFFSWAATDDGSMYPFAAGRAHELKAQLARASMRAMDAIWAERPDARFAHVEPVIHVVADPKRPQDKPEVDAYHFSQFQAWDILSGRMWPELGGKPKYLDVVGVNFYRHNQWFYNLQGGRVVRKFRMIDRRNPLYRPFREILKEVFQRYGRPMFISETGAERRARAGWLRYVSGEVLAAMQDGVPLNGICLYPIINHSGWEDGRHCENGLWDRVDEHGNRPIYRPLAKVLREQTEVFERARRDLIATAKMSSEVLAAEEWLPAEVDGQHGPPVSANACEL